MLRRRLRASSQALSPTAGQQTSPAAICRPAAKLRNQLRASGQQPGPAADCRPAAKFRCRLRASSKIRHHLRASSQAPPPTAGQQPGSAANCGPAARLCHQLWASSKAALRTPGQHPSSATMAGGGGPTALWGYNVRLLREPSFGNGQEDPETNQNGNNGTQAPTKLVTRKHKHRPKRQLGNTGTD